MNYIISIVNLKGTIAETELVLTPLRAFWLWNAAGIDLNQLKTEKIQIR